MGILNSNDYKRGFADGQKDAEIGKDPNYIKMGLSWKFAIHGGAGLDSYTRGYKDGYREVMRKSVVQKVEVVPPPNTTDTTFVKSSFKSFINHQKTLGNMDNLQRIELQLDALRKLEQFLLNTIDELHGRMQMYNDRVSALRSEGLPIEISDYYDENYCIPHNQKLWQLTQDMNDNDLLFIRDKIAKYENML